MGKGSSPPRWRQRLERDALAILAGALRAADPSPLVQAALERARPEIRGRQVRLMALGKAAWPMARAALALPWLRPLNGVVACPQVDASRVRKPLVACAGEHPVPGPGSFKAGRALLALARGAGREDTLILLLSGGGSALAAVPARGLSAADKTRIHQSLLRSGLRIGPVNLIRSRFSRLKGGCLAATASPARLLTLALLDVPRSQPWACASGPTLRLPARFAMDPVWLRQAGILLPPRAAALLGHSAPPPVRSRRGGSRPGTRFVVLGDRQLAAAGARSAARRLGYAVRVSGRAVRGDAVRLGKRLAREAARAAERARPGCLIWTGEPTVRLGSGAGNGGRCQQTALSAALAMEPVPGALVVCVGTDGQDGPGWAAGARVDHRTASRIRASGLVPEMHLRQRDAGPALSAAGALIETGPTGTNVNDLFLVLTAGS
ncbi:MAG: glycerate kinase [Acidobacteriota bacterium]